MNFVNTQRRRRDALGAALFSCVLVCAAHAQVQQRWIAGFDGPDNLTDQINDMVVRDGAIYVTGWTSNRYLRAYGTVKYDDNGNTLWTQLFEGNPAQHAPDEAWGIALDAAGNVYVTGYSVEQIPYPDHTIVHATTLKFSPAGAVLWERRYTNASRNAQATDIAVASDGAIYVCGGEYSGYGYGFDVMLLKYSAVGELLWNRTAGQPGFRGDSGYALAVDGADNAIVVGYTDNMGPGDSAAYVVKFSAAGELQWEQVRDGFSNADWAERVAVDAQDNIVVNGEIYPPGGPLKIWTAKYSPAGDLLWEDFYGGTFFHNFAMGMALDGRGNVVANGQIWHAPGTVLGTIKYNAADGSRAWVREENAGYLHASGGAVTADAAGSVYSTGYAFNDNTYEDWITYKYDSDGALLWSRALAGEEGRNDYPAAIAVDDSSNVFVAGQVWRGFEHDLDYTVVRYSQALAGDMNCDGALSIADISGFVLALTDAAEYEAHSGACDLNAADVSGDGRISVGDIGPFVTMLTASAQ